VHKKHDSTGYSTEPPQHLAAAAIPEVQAMSDVYRFGRAQPWLAHLTPVVSITRTGVFAVRDPDGLLNSATADAWQR
jgi:hypothetical protein